ncbi:hypothetical protein J6590_034017 [Homalodisca vitripennis]|nr:hypothetical protein J6590_034017 [Homalodisca vitripennis]
MRVKTVILRFIQRHARSHLESKSHHCPHSQFQCNSSMPFSDMLAATWRPRVAIFLIASSSVTVLCLFQTCSQPPGVQEHARSHLETKSHHCPHCQFQCNSSTHLNRHLRLHTGAKPFHCPHCDFSCNLLENLRKHVLSTKKHPGKCLYSCQETSCDFTSNFAKDFRVHLVSVHGQTASAATSFVTGLYNGGEDPRHVDQPLPVTSKK